MLFVLNMKMIFQNIYLLLKKTFDVFDIDFDWNLLDLRIERSLLIVINHIPILRFS